MEPTSAAAHKWNERYKEETFAYGKEPNVFFKTWLDRFRPGTILMPADGEGRNGVYAAQQGWTVTAFDLSQEGQTKALQLAREKNVPLTYHVASFEDLDLTPNSVDAVGLIYAHVDAAQKTAFHRKIDASLRTGGVVIFEAFSKQHLHYVTRNPAVGGPRDIDTLYAVEELRADFSHYDVTLLSEETIVLNEGQYHIGEGAVIRFVAQKRASTISV